MWWRQLTLAAESILIHMQVPRAGYRENQCLQAERLKECSAQERFEHWCAPDLAYFQIEIRGVYSSFLIERLVIKEVVERHPS